VPTIEHPILLQSQIPDPYQAPQPVSHPPTDFDLTSSTVADATEPHFLAYPKTSIIISPQPPADVLTYAAQQSLLTTEQPMMIDDNGDLTSCTASLPTLRNSYGKQARERFVVNNLNKHVQVLLDCPFGKDRRDISFVFEPRLRHVLLPLVFSGFLTDHDWTQFSTGCPEARVLLSLIQDHADVDFNPLRIPYPPGALQETTLNTDRVRMLTAALLYFEGNPASLIRWIQGSHVGANRDHVAVLTRWKPIWRPDTHAHLTRIWLHGCPAKLAATSTEKNYRSYFAYGNHKSYYEDPDKSMKALVKDFRRGFVMAFDLRVSYYMLYCHLNPLGMVDLHHRTKNPRPIVDSSFHALPDSMAVNDWTSKHNEPPLEFASAFPHSLVSLWNFRISYPSLEIYMGDDDVSGAFRWPKYHPVAAAMNSSRQNGVHVVNTGLTFGGETSPSNFEPHANARQQTARHLWSHPRIVEIA
jgi:hypothetical protein